MKLILVNIGVIAGILIAFYFNIFAIFTFKWLPIFAVVLVITLFVVAFFVVGNPLGGKKNERDD